MSQPDRISTQLHSDSMVTEPAENDDEQCNENGEACDVSKKIIVHTIQSVTDQSNEEITQQGLFQNTAINAAPEHIGHHVMNSNSAANPLTDEICAASETSTVIPGSCVSTDNPLNEIVDSNVIFVCNANDDKYVCDINPIDDASILEQDTTCSSRNLDEVSFDCRQKTHNNADHEGCKDSVENGTAVPRPDATEIISSRNEDLETTFRSEWRENDEIIRLKSDNMTNPTREVSNGDGVGYTEIHPDHVLFDPTDAGISSLDQNLTTTWGTFFDDFKETDTADDSHRDDESNHRGHQQRTVCDKTAISTTTIHNNLTMSNNVHFLDDHKNDNSNPSSGVSIQQGTPLISSDPTTSRDDNSNTTGLVNSSDTANNKDGFDDVTVLSTATSDDSQSTANVNQEGDLQSEDSVDMETIIGDVEAAQFDFGSVIPRCHGTVISPKDRTEEDADALLKQIINGEPDPCLAPEVIEAYVKSKIEVVEVVDVKPEQNISLHNATRENFDDGYNNTGRDIDRQDRKSLVSVSGVLYQHIIKGKSDSIADKQDSCFEEEEKNENGRFPYCTLGDVSVVDSVILTPRNSKTYCVDNESSYSGIEPTMTCSYTRVNEQSNHTIHWCREAANVNEMSESRLTEYEQNHVIYQPVRTGSFVVSRHGRVEDEHAREEGYDETSLNKNGDLQSPTEAQRRFNGNCLPYVSPESKQSLNSTPHPSPINNLAGSICPSNSEVDSLGGYKPTNRQISHAKRMNGIRSLLGPTSCLFKGQDVEINEETNSRDHSRKQYNTISLSHRPDNGTMSHNGGPTLRRCFNESPRNKSNSSPETRVRLLPDINKFQSTRNDRVPQKPSSPQRVRKIGLTVTRGSSVGQGSGGQSRDKGEPGLKRNSSSHGSSIRRKVHEKTVSRNDPRQVTLGQRGVNKKKVPPITINRDRGEMNSAHLRNDSGECAAQSITPHLKENNIISISTGSECSSSCTLASYLQDTDAQNTKHARLYPTKTKKLDTQTRHAEHGETGWTDFETGTGPYFGSYVPSCLLYTPKKHLNPKTTSAEEYHKYKMDLRLSQSLARIKRGPPTVDCYLETKFKPKQERARSRSQKRHNPQHQVPPASHVVPTTTLDTNGSTINRNKNSTKQLTVA